MLERGELDICPTDFMITENRSKVVDFLPGLAGTYMQLFLKNPADALHWNAYTDPFTPLCWVGTLIFILLVAPIISGILFFGKYKII